MSIKNKFREENKTMVLDTLEMGHLVEDAEEWWDAGSFTSNQPSTSQLYWR